MLSVLTVIACTADPCTGPDLHEVVIRSEGATKAGTAGAEETISRLSVVLFQDGRAKAFGTESSGEIRLTVPIGTYDILAVANCPAFVPSSTMTPASAAGTVTSLEQNSRSSLVMSGGMLNQTLTAADRTVLIPVKRHVCRVVLERVETDFSNTLYEGKTLTLKKIYLSNVWRQCSVGTTGPERTAPTASGAWYNRYGYSAATASEVLIAETGLSVSIPDGGVHTAKHYFYTYPNASTATAADTSVPCTRLVLEATLSGKTCFYHVDLPDLYSNSSHHLSLCIRNMGGETPEQNMEKAVLDFRVQVADWETGGSRSLTLE